MRIAIAASLTLALGAGSVLAQQTGSITPAPAAPRTEPPVPAKPKPAPLDKQAAKRVRAEGIAECMRLWDTKTHMSRQEWARTCERVQTRLENLRIENLDPAGTGARKAPGGKPDDKS
jgi:hypothetical protein